MEDRFPFENDRSFHSNGPRLASPRFAVFSPPPPVSPRDRAYTRLRDIILGRQSPGSAITFIAGRPRPSQAVLAVLNRVERGRRRYNETRARAPLITPDIRNFHNLFHAPGSLRTFIPSHPPRAAIGGAYSLQPSASRGPSRTCECINTGCTLHKLRVET